MLICEVKERGNGLSMMVGGGRSRTVLQAADLFASAGRFPSEIFLTICKTQARKLSIIYPLSFEGQSPGTMIITWGFLFISCLFLSRI